MVAPLRDPNCDICTWRADRAFTSEELASLRVCAGHAHAAAIAKETLAAAKKRRDAQEADAKDLLYSLGAP